VQSSPPEDARLGVGRAVRRHLAIVLGVLVLFPIAAAVLVLGRTTLYTSSTTVFLRPTLGNALSPDSAKNAQQVTVAMQTEAGLVSAPQVAALVSKTLKTVVEAGSSKVAASVPPNTQIVEIRYTAGAAESARAGSEAYANAFLAARKAVSDDSVKRQLQLLKEQATSVTTNLSKVSADAASANPSPDSAALVQLYTNRLTNLQDLIGQLETTDTNPGSVVTPATTPAGGAPLGSVLVLGAAAILGLLAGVSLAVWRERGDDRIRASDDETVGGVAKLAQLPGVQAHDSATRERQRLELSNGYRHARASVLIALHGRAVVAVAGADTSPAVPTGVIAANLAACLAGGRYNVCVLDVSDAASSAPSKAAQVLGVTPVPVTLPAEAGRGGPRLDRIPRGLGVGVVTLDRVPEDDPGLFVSSRFLELITGLHAKYDIVIVAAPPLRSAHGTEVCLVADGVLVVVTDRRTTRESVKELVTQQSRLRVPVLGLISLKPPRRGGAGRAAVSYDAIDLSAGEPDPLSEIDPEPAAAPDADAARADVPSVHRPSSPRLVDGERPPATERPPVTERPADRAPKRVKAEPGRPSGVAGVEDDTVVLRRAQVNAKLNGKPAAGQPDGRGVVRTKGGPVWFDQAESDD
jgi:Mrp family chromosome partitioning ATPase